MEISIHKLIPKNTVYWLYYRFTSLLQTSINPKVPNSVTYANERKKQFVVTFWFQAAIQATIPYFKVVLVYSALAWGLICDYKKGYLGLCSAEWLGDLNLQDRPLVCLAGENSTQCPVTVHESLKATWCHHARRSVTLNSFDESNVNCGSHWLLLWAIQIWIELAPL